MRLLLIRHGETVDNVAQVYAGIRDSPLTSHGVLQAARLSSYLASANVKMSHIFSSDLQRAFKTAESLRLAQSIPLAETTKLKLLREQDFGSYEGRAFNGCPPASDKKAHDAQHEHVRNDHTFKDRESKESMMFRMKTFIDLHLVELFQTGTDGDTVVVVAHGIILSYLWQGILQRFDQRNVLLAPSVMVADRGMGLQYLGGWSNTGYMDLEIKRKLVSIQGTEPASSKLQPSTAVPETTSSCGARESHTSKLATALVEPPSLHGIISIPSQSSLTVFDPPPEPRFERLSLMVKGVNCRDHLRDLKKTRGGIGSLKHDEKQTTMDAFVKRRKIE